MRQRWCTYEPPSTLHGLALQASPRVLLQTLVYILPTPQPLLQVEDGGEGMTKPIAILARPARWPKAVESAVQRKCTGCTKRVWVTPLMMQNPILEPYCPTCYAKKVT